MEENLKKVFRARLIEAMEGAGMTQAELARQTGCGRELIHYYTHGRQVPNFYNAYAIAKALGVELYWLMGVEEDGALCRGAGVTGGASKAPGTERVGEANLHRAPTRLASARGEAPTEKEGG